MKWIRHTERSKNGKFCRELIQTWWRRKIQNLRFWAHIRTNRIRRFLYSNENRLNANAKNNYRERTHRRISAHAQFILKNSLLSLRAFFIVLFICI